MIFKKSNEEENNYCKKFRRIQTFIFNHPLSQGNLHPSPPPKQNSCSLIHISACGYFMNTAFLTEYFSPTQVY